MSEVEFIDGLMVKEPRVDFIKASLSIKREELIAWLQGKDDEWINADVKVGKSGKWYVAVNNWKPNNQAPEEKPQPLANQGGFKDDDPFGDSIPF